LKPSNPDDILEGTTRRVFRFVYHQRTPVGISDIQRGLGLSSPSVAYYHVNKLLSVGLLKEDGSGYSVEKNVFEGMVRVRKRVVPLHSAYVAFLLTALVAMLSVLHPTELSADYLFAVIVMFVVTMVAVYEAFTVSKKSY
jgi:hypothetical protein